MAELNSKLHCKKDGTVEEITAYTTLDEVQGQGIPVRIGDVDAYIKYGDSGDENASQLNCKIPNISNVQKVHKVAITYPTITFMCFDVETKQQISSIRYAVPDNGILYLNNENAPVVNGYDFVMLDGVKHQNVKEDDVFKVWYVNQSIPDRTLENWDTKFWDDQVGELPPAINTFNATSMFAMFYAQSNKDFLLFNSSNVTNMAEMFMFNGFSHVPLFDTSNVTNMRMMFAGCSHIEEVPLFDTSKVVNMDGMFGRSFGELMGVTGAGCGSLKTIPAFNTVNVTDMRNMFNECYKLESVPSLNTSKVTDMFRMFNECYKLTSVGYMDTSKVTNMGEMFYCCESLTHLDWAIDMSSIEDMFKCRDMFVMCPIQNVHLKNVRRGLDLTGIGTDSYIVDNYID